MTVEPVLSQVEVLIAAGDVAGAEALLRHFGLFNLDIAFAHAVRLLAGDGLSRDVPASRTILADAARRGHLDSAMFEASMLANGFGGPPDWGTALELLKACSAREPAANEQARLLATMDIDDLGMPRRAPAAALVARSPNIYRVAQFATVEECAYLARSVSDILAPAVVHDPITGVQRRHPVRRSSSAVVGPTREDLVVNALAKRIASATCTDWRAAEPFHVLHYAPADEYRLHHDMVAGDHNPRIYTAILYLNDNFTGGETFFPANDFSARPRVGDLLFFCNVEEAGRPDPLAIHAGLPVKTGVKWIATRWIRQQPLDLTAMHAA